jgi:small subunit ribosomal protein S11
VNKNLKKKSPVLKKKVNISSIANVHIQATFNNVIMSIANENGDVIVWSSSGKKGFKGAKKSTPYAAKCVAEDCSKEAYSLGIREVNIFVKGPGIGRESAIRTIETLGGLYIRSISDVTRIPYNGCRPSKRRRL